MSRARTRYEIGTVRRYVGEAGATRVTWRDIRVISQDLDFVSLDRFLRRGSGMKYLVMALVLAAGCAGQQTHFVNVAAVRNDINATIKDESGSRYVVSMGHTTNENAVVYTQTDKSGPLVEETWIHAQGAWKMTEVKGAKDQAHR